MENNNTTNGVIISTSNPFDECSDDDLIALIASNPKMVSMIAIAKATLESRELAREKIERERVFADGLTKLVKKLGIPPESFHNAFLAYTLVTKDDNTKPATDVTIIDTQAVMDSENKVVTPSTSHVEKRYPKVQVYEWTLTVNHICNVPQSDKAGKQLSEKTSGRVHIYKHEADKADTDCGIHASYQAFANVAEWYDDKGTKHTGINTGTDSANRAITKYGYYGVKC
jgi:hypothetical protein